MLSLNLRKKLYKLSKMKFIILFASLISFVAASGHYGHHIPARVDIAPGGVETIYTQKVIPQVVSVLF